MLLIKLKHNAILLNFMDLCPVIIISVCHMKHNAVYKKKKKTYFSGSWNFLSFLKKLFSHILHSSRDKQYAAPLLK